MGEAEENESWLLRLVKTGSLMGSRVGTSSSSNQANEPVHASCLVLGAQ